MKIERVCYEELFPTGAYANQRLRADILLDDSDDPIRGFLLAKELVHKAFEQTKPMEVDYSSIPGHPTHVTEPKSEEQISHDQQVQGYHQIINSKWVTVKGLEQYREKIKALSNEALTEAFENKLKQLQ